MGQETVYSWYDPVQMAKILTSIHKRTGFPGLEKLFAAANGYLILINHSHQGIYEVTITFLDTENVDFGMPYFWHFGSTSLYVIVLVTAIFDFRLYKILSRGDRVWALRTAINMQKAIMWCKNQLVPDVFRVHQLCPKSIVFLQYFDTVGWVFRPVKTVARITYTVLVET